MVTHSGPTATNRPTVGSGHSWSYTFIAYSNFTSGANAVTPRASWPASPAPSTPVSTTVPYEAINFSLWRTIGKEFLIKSNINNWIACKEGTGSLVQWKAEPITCQVGGQTGF